MQALAQCPRWPPLHLVMDHPTSCRPFFIKEAKTLKRSMIQNTTFVPMVEFSSPTLKGIDSMPPLQPMC